MTEKRVLIGISAALLVFLALVYCDSYFKKRSRLFADAQKIKAELARVNAALEKTQIERDRLKNDIVRVAEHWEKAKADLAAVSQEKAKLQTEVAALTDRLNVVLTGQHQVQAMLEDFGNVLKQKQAEIAELEAVNRTLEAALRELQGRIEQAPKPPTEPAPEPPKPHEPPVDANSF